MTGERRSRVFWCVCLATIIAAGILSRVVHTGFVILDKYLGDALYAAMVYTILRIATPVRSVAVWSMAIMSALEFFQLTGIPASLLTSQSSLVRLSARLMGTTFSWLDLVAYSVGVASLSIFEWLPAMRCNRM